MISFFIVLCWYIYWAYNNTLYNVFIKDKASYPTWLRVFFVLYALWGVFNIVRFFYNLSIGKFIP